MFQYYLLFKELHAHLNGSLSKETFKKLSSKYESDDVKEYCKLHDILEKDTRSLEECFKIFGFAHKLTSTPQAVYQATIDVIEEFDKDNVIYLELRTTPRNEENMTTEDYIQAVIKAIKESKKLNSIVVKLILSINREHTVEMSSKNLETILKMHKNNEDIIKGVDLCGNPIKGSFKNIKHLFERAREANLLVTLHCGEVLNNREVKDILEFRPDRIGHGTYVHSSFGGNEENLQLLRKYRIPTECCLTSNVLCGTVKCYKEHHIKKLMEENLPFCLSTDDKGVFNTSLTKEYLIANKELNFSVENLWDANYSTVDFCFATKEEKRMLREKFHKWKMQNLTD